MQSGSERVTEQRMGRSIPTLGNEMKGSLSTICILRLSVLLVQSPSLFLERRVSLAEKTISRRRPGGSCKN